MTANNISHKATIVRLLRGERRLFSEADQDAIVAAKRVRNVISYYPDSLWEPLPPARLVREVERALANGTYNRLAAKRGFKLLPTARRPDLGK